MLSPRVAWVAVAVAVTVVAGVVGASRLGLLDASVAGRPSAVQAGRVDVPADRPTDVRVDARWTVHIPAGGVRVDSTLTVAFPRDPGGPVGSTPLAAAVLRLSSGQPSLPWTFTWRQDQALAADQILYLVDDTGDGEAYGAGQVTERVTPATVIPATMSADRRTGTVEVPHLSFFQWLVDLPSVASNAVGKFFGQRSDSPDCPGARPEWLSDAIFLDDRNAPMLVCVGGDPNKPDLAVVKVVNNRGGALLVTAPVVPDWAWQSFVGKEMESWAPNLLTHVVEYLGVPPADAVRTWILPPGQEVDLGFSRATLGTRSPVEVAGMFSPTTMVLGLTSKAVSDVLDEGSRGWDFVLMGACLESMGARVVDDSSAAGLAQGLASLARCVVEQPETVIQVLRKLLPAAVWQKMSGMVFRVANLAKKALTRYLVLAEATFTIADVVTTLALPRSAFTVSRFPRTNATEKLPFVGHWAVHGSQLDINADGTGLLTWNGGPCTSSTSETRRCSGNATIAFTAGVGETLQGSFVEVWYTTDDGSPVTDYEYSDSGYLPAETFTLARNDEHTLISSGGGPDDPDGPGNPYLCDEYAMQHNDGTYDLCGA